MQTGWPTQTDYVDALQHPPSAFADPLLAAGTVETEPVLGLPKPRSGQMASVYKVFAGRGTWAVRCFNYRAEDRAAHYGAISRYLARQPNRYTVGFVYDPAGIVVSGQRYPMVMMEWVEGDLLPAYIAKHLDDPAALARLAAAWVEMATELHALHIAHGDLQHGNVLVTPHGELKLVDYDGMFVPEFAGRRSPENGHPNFQHPLRDGWHFGAQLDNFSAWVIYLSLYAVARDPSLWTTLGYGDECLALRRTDFVRPSASSAFEALAGSDADVARLASYVRALLAHEPDALPALESVLNANVLRTYAAGGTTAPFDASPPLGAAFREPFVAAADAEKTDPPDPQASSAAADRPARRGKWWAGIGIVVSLAGYGVFRGLGFSDVQYLAVVALAWILVAVLALASRGPRSPGAPRD